MVSRLRILHTCLNVSDLDKSLKFYTENLSLSLTRRREIEQNNAEIAFLEDHHGAAIELTHWRDKKKLLEGDNFDHIAFAIDDIDAAIKRLESKGVEIAMEPYSLQGSTSRIAFIKDPDGNWLELIQSK